LGIKDQQVAKLKTNFLMDLGGVIYALISMVACIGFALPGIILNGPIGIILRILGEK